MQTVTLELPDESATKLNSLSNSEKKQIIARLDFWLSSMALVKKKSPKEILHELQDKIAAMNLSEEEVNALIEESMT